MSEAIPSVWVSLGVMGVSMEETSFDLGLGSSRALVPPAQKI